MGVDVNHFAGEEEVRNQLAAQCTGLNFLHGDAAAGDDRFGQGPGRPDGQRQGLQRGDQGFPLGGSDLVAGQVR